MFFWVFLLLLATTCFTAGTEALFSTSSSGGGSSGSDKNDFINLGVSQTTHSDYEEYDREDIERYVEETQEYVRTKVWNVLSPEQTRRCQDFHEHCAVWSLEGECQENEEYMERQCAASCRVCHAVLPNDDLCFWVDSGPDAWQPGDLDAMFRRIVDQYSTTPYNLQILSSPDTTTVVTKASEEKVPGPWVLSMDNFLTPEETKRFIELGIAEGYEASTLEASGLEPETRTSSNSWCTSATCAQDPVTKKVLQRVYDLTSLSADYSEDVQMLYYEPGQYYKVHHDYYEVSEEDAKQHGVRILTVFLYLNDVTQGGGTSFPELNVTVMPKNGRVLLWPSVLDSDPTVIDWSTEHEALSVEPGSIKYAANVWFHLKPYRLGYTRFMCCKKRRAYVENGPNALKPGDLNRMFERIVDDDNYRKQYSIQVVSSPASYSQKNGSNSSVVLDGPWVIVLNDFLSAKESSRLIELGAREGYESSQIQNGDGADVVDDTWRTSLSTWCEAECMKDDTVRSIYEKLNQLIQIDSDYCEKMQLLKYQSGQFYKTHSDFLDLSEEEEQQVGNRILTVFMYLSDVKEGGQTSFPDLNLTVSPKIGRVVLWPSVLNDDPLSRDERTEHEALPVLRGSKYGANVWYLMKAQSTAYLGYLCDDDEEDDDMKNDVIHENGPTQHYRGWHETRAPFHASFEL